MLIDKVIFSYVSLFIDGYLFLFFVVLQVPLFSAGSTKNKKRK